MNALYFPENVKELECLLKMPQCKKEGTKSEEISPITKDKQLDFSHTLKETKDLKISSKRGFPISCSSQEECNSLDQVKMYQSALTPNKAPKNKLRRMEWRLRRLQVIDDF
ncbi:unnamed protein product [Moneuplotes crassus]|uniref:Uncharacterized protein n=1 Tax=Euplotes crassus TaxID=5936 RepID=A0AAD1ULB6_EUPCR|nr:unnamed protein product [Moneuplotes crassus]